MKALQFKFQQWQRQIKLTRFNWIDQLNITMASINNKRSLFYSRTSFYFNRSSTSCHISNIDRIKCVVDELSTLFINLFASIWVFKQFSWHIFLGIRRANWIGWHYHRSRYKWTTRSRQFVNCRTIAVVWPGMFLALFLQILVTRKVPLFKIKSYLKNSNSNKIKKLSVKSAQMFAKKELKNKIMKNVCKNELLVVNSCDATSQANRATIKMQSSFIFDSVWVCAKIRTEAQCFFPLEFILEAKRI